MKDFDIMLKHTNNSRLLESRKAVDFAVAMTAVLTKANATIGLGKYKCIEIKAIKNKTSTSNILEGAY